MRMRRWATESVHVSWHIAAASSGVLIGAVLPAFMPYGVFASGSWIIVSAALFTCAVVRPLRVLLLISLFAGVSLGAWRGGTSAQASTAYAPYYGHTVQLSGVVKEDVSLGKQGDLRLQLAGVKIGQHVVGGKIWASIPPSRLAVKRGDTVHLKGVLDEGFGTMTAAMYRAQLSRVERPHPGDMARRFRDWFADGVRQSIAEPQASLGIGFLTGQHSALPASLDEQLRVAGLTHIVVASGYNLTVLVGFARRLFAGVSKYVSTVVSVCMIGGFMMTTGLSASMSRAGLVAALSLAAWYYGRAMHPLVLLPFAACITVLADPSFIWGDVGWYLSFLAFFGVIVLAPLLREYFWPGTKTGPLKQIIFDTTAAQLMTLPIILLLFGQFSSYALLANALILPFVPLAMLLTFLSGVGGLLAPGLDHILGWPPQTLLEGMTGAVAWVADLPGAAEEVRISLPLCIVSYVLLTGLCVYLQRKTAYDFRES